MVHDKLSILIVDDEPEARDLLEMLLEPLDGVCICGSAENVDEAVALAGASDPDLVLLDIQMPGKSGFELVSALRDQGYETGYIFVTAYDEYAIQAIRASAFDYLLKPVDQYELMAAIARYRIAMDKRAMGRRIDELLVHMGAGQRLKLNTRTGFQLIEPGRIVYCEADGNYTRIRVADNRCETVSTNLGTLEKELPANGFFRVSRSALINLDYLQMVDSKKGVCRLKGGGTYDIRVTRKQLRKLEALLGG